MITINDIQAAIKKEADAARVLENAKAAHEAAQVTFNDVHGMDYHLTKLFCKRGDTNAETALASNEGENVRAAFDRYVSANERAAGCDVLVSVCEYAPEIKHAAVFVPRGVCFEFC